ncbi:MULTISPECIES: hypothetical protein [Maribellus]|uniref:HEPN domain-containing protein n=1 Tax=Maribellus comscasis TaxID=2681766 RepID=A0A6I6JVE3_9BACT|nr:MULTISPECIES: hypothetical protein [Maribellus]MCG6190354.1 hypothetical protein [Maribellus maritimus]QGY45068.1 HEPN domain-containing protein [Maribellus comscasis]
MEEWKKYYDEAASYSKAAFGAFNKKRLGNHVVYNLIGLAIENYLTALCMKLGIMPEHSSIGSMLHLLKKQVEVPDTFSAEARFINKFMNFCSLEVLDTPEPGASDLVRMLSFTEDVKNFTEQILGVKAENV